MVDKSGDIELYSCNLPSLIFHIIRRIHYIFQIGSSYSMLTYAGTFKMPGYAFLLQLSSILNIKNANLMFLWKSYIYT